MGGIELMTPWPASALGPAPTMEADTEREANDAERDWVQANMADECLAHDLIPVHTRVACVHRPGEGFRVRLAVVIIGRRWVHARTTRSPSVMFAPSS